ncbi:hypothetical protein TNIN_482491 [Trichonephila inaurata madagascariensis]|uniref:Uncharacterized protein n=1 Tax=Trichonephila inaurata madagascariensis TaxID=2747483 RepID=A0A8X6I578_9ARAC|nr:hypothetical protein TNIN_482491 [Trichonephila inaurata madagascariensis]
MCHMGCESRRLMCAAVHSKQNKAAQIPSCIQKFIGEQLERNKVVPDLNPARSYIIIIWTFFRSKIIQCIQKRSGTHPTTPPSGLGERLSFQSLSQDDQQPNSQSNPNPGISSI